MPQLRSSYLIIDQYGMYAGAQRVALEAAAILNESGRDVAILAPYGEFAVQARLRRIVYRAAEPHNLMSAVGDILTGKPPRSTVVITNGPRVLGLGAYARLRYGCKWFAYIHSRPERRWQRGALWALTNLAHQTVVVAAALLPYAAAPTRVLHNAAAKSIVLNPSVAPSFGAIKFLGRNDPVKGVDHFIDVARHVTQDAPSLEVKFEAGVSSGLHDVSLPRSGQDGRVAFSSDKDALWFSPGDMVLVCSSYEACPLVVLEAQARGAVVVAYDVGGVSELIEHGKTGFLVEEREPARMAAVVRRALADKAVLASISRNSRVMARVRAEAWPIELIETFSSL